MNKSNKFVPQISGTGIDNANDNLHHGEDFISMLEEVDTTHIREDIVAKGQVIGIDKNVVIIDVGLKNEGRIPIAEFLNSPTDTLPTVGSFVDVFIDKSDGRKGTILSRTKAIREESWEKLEELFKKGENVNGTIFDRVKGGFTVNIQGVIAFLPGSQLDIRPVKDAEALMHIEQPFQIVKMDRKFGNIVVSRRAILEELRAGAREEVLSHITEGTIFTGVVKNITNYGAFIDLGDIDGLLHVTDISWRRISHPSEILSFGQEIKVIVTKYDQESKRVSLGMKQLDSNPWDNIREEFLDNQVKRGKITNITDYGIFVELREGVEGLVHSSEIAWGKANNKTFFIGQEVDFIVMEIDVEKRRISLSIKRCVENPIAKFAKNNPPGSVIKAPIRNIADFGMFVSIADNMDGMVHKSEISWTGNPDELLKSFKKGDEIECKVISIDVDKERVALGIKQLTDNPSQENLKEFKKNMTVTCTVSKIHDDGLEVIVEGKAKGFIKKMNLSSERYEQKPERFAEGDRIDAKIISVDKKTDKLSLSVSAFEKDERERVIKKYGSTDSGASLGGILGIAFDEHKNKLNAENKESAASRSAKDTDATENDAN